MKDFVEAMQERRSIYTISKGSTITEERIMEIVKESVKFTPTAFNSQSGRVVVLLQKQHDRLWEITREALRAIVPEENFARTKEKLDSFQEGCGTILFYEDMAVVETLQEQFSIYKDNFPVWSQQSSGILQYIIWTSLSIERMGASLQHYNELIEEAVKKEWKIPEKWKLIAQMPFGKPTAAAGEKEFEDVDARVKLVR